MNRSVIFVAVLIVSLFAVVGLRRAPTTHAAPPCDFVAGWSSPATTPHGGPEAVSAFAHCAGASRVVLFTLISGISNGVGHSLAYAASVDGPFAYTTWQIPTSLLPPGAYTVTVYAEVGWSPTTPATWVPATFPVPGFTVTPATP